MISPQKNKYRKEVTSHEYDNTRSKEKASNTAAAALNGMDFDGDLVMLTDNKVLVAYVAGIERLGRQRLNSVVAKIEQCRRQNCTLTE